MSYVENVKEVAKRQSFLLKEAKRYFKNEKDMQSLIDQGYTYENEAKGSVSQAGFGRSPDPLVDRVASAKAKRLALLQEHSNIDIAIGVSPLTEGEFLKEMEYLSNEHQNQLDQKGDSEDVKIGRIKRSFDKELRSKLITFFKKKAKIADNINKIALTGDNSVKKINADLIYNCDQISKKWGTSFDKSILTSSNNPIYDGLNAVLASSSDDETQISKLNGSSDNGSLTTYLNDHIDQAEKSLTFEPQENPFDAVASSDSDIISASKDVREKIQSESVSSDIDEIFSDPEFLKKKKQADIEREKIRKAREQEVIEVQHSVSEQPVKEEVYENIEVRASGPTLSEDIQAINAKLLARVRELESINRELSAEYLSALKEITTIKEIQRDAITRSLEVIEAKKARQNEMAVELSSYEPFYDAAS